MSEDRKRCICEAVRITAKFDNGELEGKNNFSLK